MANVLFSFAELDDLPALMAFMDRHWRKGHILAKSERLWRHEFLHGDRLTMAVAKSAEGELLAIFGYIPYNASPLPDIAGSLWKVTDTAQQQYPMLGIQLRNFVIRSVAHRFFAAPGAGLQTRPIYQVIRMNWQRMQHYFWLNPAIQQPQLVKTPADYVYPGLPTINPSSVLRLQRLDNAEQMAAFDFDHYQDIVPFKDQAYAARRFFDYPYFDYNVYAVYQGDHCCNLVMCRRATAEGKTALRLVDFYGEETHLSDILRLLCDQAVASGDEYVDFVCHGFGAEAFYRAGWQALDFDQDALTVPNFFEPFLLKNVAVYCVSDPTPYRYRQCKADGDQDRPNYIR